MSERIVRENLPSEPSWRGLAPKGTTAAALLFAATVFQLVGCTTAPARVGSGGAVIVVPSRSVATASATSEQRELEAKYGIRVDALRLSSAGYMLDLRYRVLDPQKAAPLLDRKMRPPYLLDANRGAKFGVPDTEILGQLRQTARNNKISVDHSYFVLFANPARYLHAGDRVTLVMGDAKLTDLLVE